MIYVRELKPGNSGTDLQRDRRFDVKSGGHPAREIDAPAGIHATNFRVDKGENSRAAVERRQQTPGENH
jgi:hypothetical protein